jgi:hypothetical protein
MILTVEFLIDFLKEFKCKGTLLLMLVSDVLALLFKTTASILDYFISVKHFVADYDSWGSFF